MAFAKKATTDTSVFSLTLPLRCEPWQKDRLDKIFWCHNRIKNALINDKLNDLRLLESTKRWKAINRELGEALAQKKCSNASNKALQSRIKELYEEKKHMLLQYGFSKGAFEKKAVRIRKHYGNNVFCDVAQKVSYTVWDAFEDYFYGKGKEISFSSIADFCCIEGKSNKTGPRFEDSCLLYGKMRISAKLSKHDTYGYEEQALQRPVHYCKIKRKWYPDGWNYFVQLILGGTVPLKLNKDTGELLHPIGHGDVGLDIGPQTLAVVSDTSVSMNTLAERVLVLHGEIEAINQAMDRSRRATNPWFFNAKGEVIRIDRLPENEHIVYRHGKRRRLWVESKRYKELKAFRRYLYRLQAESRLQQHNELANRILSLGNSFYIEAMRFSALAKKSKETKKRADGRYASKKRFGKSVGNRAPTTFVSILKRKVVEAGGSFSNIDTTKAKASQFDHTNDTYKKKSLSQRWAHLSDGTTWQRDLYSAFLIQSTKPTLDGFDQEKLEARYSAFQKLHNTAIQELTHKKTPSSTGVKRTA